MQTLPTQFLRALENIEIRGQKQLRAQKANLEVRAVLENSPRLKEWGIDTILIGSYARHTGVHPGKDVDVFGRLTALDTSSDPNVVFGEFAKVLEESLCAVMTLVDSSSGVASLRSARPAAKFRAVLSPLGGAARFCGHNSVPI